MKHNILIGASCLLLSLSMTVAAQDFNQVIINGGENYTKCDKVYTPEAGDFSVGVDLIPLFRTIGGAFNDSETPVGGNPFSVDDMVCKPTVSVIGKYMFTDKWALKANIGLMVNTHTNRSYVLDDKMQVLAPQDEAKVVDSQKITKSGGSFMVGAEYRLGKRRVQGIFGVGILFGFSTLKESYSYGNAITEFNQEPTSAISSSEFGIPYGYRIKECQTSGANIMAGVYGSAGAEWFVAPKISLGADVKLSLYGIFGNQGWVKSEGWSDAYQRVTTRTDLVTPGNRGFNFSTDNIGGSLYMSFYF